MKKVIGLLTLAILLISVSVAQAQPPEHEPGYKINGQSWLASSYPEKVSFIAGMDGVVAVEHAIDARREEIAKANNTPQKDLKPSVVSPFEDAWAKVFVDKKNSDIVLMIDEFYQNNPDKLNTTVLEVIWYELLAPNYKRG